MDNNQWSLPEFEPDEEVGRIWKVRQANGHYHYAMCPNPGSGEWVAKDHPAFLEAMGRLGYSCLDEVPMLGDNTAERCERCSDLGVEYHHTAPRKVFGDDAETYPLVKLCPPCHVRWHEMMCARAHDYTVGQLKRLGYYKLASAVAKVLGVRSATEE